MRHFQSQFPEIVSGVVLINESPQHMDLIRNNSILWPYRPDWTGQHDFAYIDDPFARNILLASQPFGFDRLILPVTTQYSSQFDPRCNNTLCGSMVAAATFYNNRFAKHAFSEVHSLVHSLIEIRPNALKDVPLAVVTSGIYINSTCEEAFPHLSSGSTRTSDRCRYWREYISAIGQHNYQYQEHLSSLSSRLVSWKIIQRCGHKMQLDCPEHALREIMAVIDAAR